MFTLMVEEPTFTPGEPIDKAAVMSPTSGFSAKSRMVMGTLRLCNADVDACKAARRQIRKTLASTANGGKNNKVYVSWSDVYVECLESTATRSASASASSVVMGGCNTGTSVVAYEMYFKNTLITLVNDNLMTAIEANDGDPNPSGYINDGTQYNYVFVNDLHAFQEEDGNTVPLDQLRLWVGDFATFKAKSCFTAGYCLFDSYASKGLTPAGSAGAMTTSFPSLNGRSTSRSDDDSCDASTTWRCAGKNKINALRAEGGLRELNWSDALETTARGYANELCRSGNTTHVNEATIEWNETTNAW